MTKMKRLFNEVFVKDRLLGSIASRICDACEIGRDVITIEVNFKQIDICADCLRDLASRIEGAGQ
jgi:DNA-binding protein